MAATEMAHSEASMTCAALRDRPRPLFITARPAMARGISRIANRQAAPAGVSENEDAVREITAPPRAGVNGYGTREPAPSVPRQYPPGQRQSAPAIREGDPARTRRSPTPPAEIRCPQVS